MDFGVEELVGVLTVLHGVLAQLLANLFSLFLEVLLAVQQLLCFFDFGQIERTEFLDLGLAHSGSHIFRSLQLWLLSSMHLELLLVLFKLGVQLLLLTNDLLYVVQEVVLEKVVSLLLEDTQVLSNVGRDTLLTHS